MAILKPPLYFVLHMNRLDDDINKVAHLISSRYVRDMLVASKALLTHNLEMEARILQLFHLSFKSQVSRYAKIGSRDLFGNIFLGMDSYDFVEVTVSYDYKTLSSVRFLRKGRTKDDRYAVYGVPILIDPTTLNIVSNIRELADSVEDFFDKISTLFTCRPGSWAEDIDIINDIGSMTSGAIDSDVVSKIGWNEFIYTYFVPSPIVVPAGTLTRDQLDALSKKYDGKLFKSPNDILIENEDFFGLKSEIARIAKNGFEVNNAGKHAFFTDIDKQIETCAALFSNVFDKFTLGCLIQEALECIKPALSCKEILRGLEVRKLTR